MTFGRQGSRVGLIASVLFIAFLHGCAMGGGRVETARSAELDRLAGFMAGAFSSERQAAHDSDFYDVRLKMAPIWTDRGDGHWFYVEQAMLAHLGRPYRQRVYRLTEPTAGLFVSDVYTMEDPDRFVGVWSRPQAMATLTPDSLELRDGCAIRLRQITPGVFRGETSGSACESSLRGASYATSRVVVTEHAVASWDQGFDSEGRQVWGAVSGPYVFDKLIDWSGRLATGVAMAGQVEGNPGWGRPSRRAEH